MGHRLTRIVTRTGDDGTTGLGDGSRTRKDTERIAALGDVDELNSVLGVLRAEALPAEIDADLSRIQHDLFDVGAELCIPGHRALHDAQVAFLDDRLAHYNADLPPLQEFILPGGARTAALAHLVRTTARRAERSVVTLAFASEPNAGHTGHTGHTAHASDTGATGGVHAPVRLYLNRLSDLMFVLARVLNRHAGGSDVYWQRPQAADSPAQA